MPEFESTVTLPNDLDVFTRSYLETAEWADIMEDCTDPLGIGCHEHDRKSEACVTDREWYEDAANIQWHPESITKAKADCAAFQRDNAQDIGDEHERAGHDFWLTRNGHGAGFWDGDWPKDAGQRLTEASKAYRECHVEVNPTEDGESVLLSLY